MGSLSFVQSLVIAVFFIILGAILIGKGPAVAEASFGLAEGSLEQLGINIFSPKVAELLSSVRKEDGALTIAWKFNKPATILNAKGGIADYKVIFSYSALPGGVKKDVCTASRVGSKPDPMPGFLCSITDAVATINSDIAVPSGLKMSSAAPSGEYKVTLILVPKKGREFYGQLDSAGIYTKSYLEGLAKKPWAGTEKCDVCEKQWNCERDNVIASWSSTCIRGVAKVYGRYFSSVYGADGKKITSQDLNYCRAEPETLKTQLDKSPYLQSCEGNTLTSLMIKASQWAYFKELCENFGLRDETAGQIRQVLEKDSGTMTPFDAAAVSITQKQTECLSGTENVLRQRGWQFMPMPADLVTYKDIMASGVEVIAHDLHSADAKTEIRKYVSGFLPPVVTKLEANLAGNKFTLTWKVPTGADNMGSLALLHEYGTHFKADTYNYATKPVSLPPNARTYQFPLEKGQVAGQHRFTITAEAAKSVELGIYDRNYVELYDADVANCREGSFRSNVNTAAAKNLIGTVGCNVVKKKRDALRDGGNFARKAYDNFRKDAAYQSSACNLNSLAKCNAAEVNRIYQLMAEAARGKDAAALIINCDATSANIGLWASNAALFTAYRNVCAAKDSLIASLRQARWQCVGDSCPSPGVKV